MTNLKSHGFTDTINMHGHATTLLNSEFVDVFRLIQIYRCCQHAGTCDNPSKQRICWCIQINTTNKSGWKHNGMMTTKLIINSTPEEWSQQCFQEQTMLQKEMISKVTEAISVLLNTGSFYSGIQDTCHILYTCTSKSVHAHTHTHTFTSYQPV